jgi:hypothetical protein
MDRFMTIARNFLVVTATLQMLGCGGNSGIRQGETAHQDQRGRSQHCQKPPREETCKFNRDKSTIPTQTSDDRAEIIAWATDLPGTKIHVLVNLPDVEFDWEWFEAQRSDEARSQVIEVRRKQIDALFVDITRELKCLGIEVRGRFWSDPMIGFEIDSLRAARVVATWPIERRVTIDR